jgi:hypothetical protein
LSLVIVVVGLRRNWRRKIAGCAGFEEGMSAFFSVIRQVASAATKSHNGD